MEESSESSVAVGLLLPFDYQLYQVAIVLDVIQTVNSWSQRYDRALELKLEIVQTHGQIKEYSDTFFNYPVKNTLSDEVYDYVIIPPFNTDFTFEIIEKNKLFKEWILKQYENQATVFSIGNGISLLAYCGLLEGQEISISGLGDDFFSYFPELKKVHGTYIQYLDRMVLCSGRFRLYYLLFGWVRDYVGDEVVVQLAKYYQVDLNLTDSRHYEEFEFIYETMDKDIEAILSKIHLQFATIESLDDVLGEYPGSRRSFNRKFLEQTRKTPIQYLQNVRIAYAKRLLETTEQTIEEVAKSVGYEDLKSFRAVFVRITGLLPLDYKKRLDIKNLYKTKKD